MCDLVYAEHVDRLERQVLAERQVAAVLLAAGAKDVTLPTIAEARAEFDRVLIEEPRSRRYSRDELSLRRALGVAS